jgi:hypothetical protein
MQYFRLLNSIVNLALVILAVYLGLFKNEYAHASFLLLLSMINGDSFKN